MKSRNWVYLAGGAAILVGIAGYDGWKMIARPEQALLSVAAGTGPDPKLPSPNKTMFPTINVATPIGWAANSKPIAAPGLVVNSFAKGLEHPRWLYTLPNGDVLVAESDSPGTDRLSLKNLAAGYVMRKVGAGTKSPNKIILLRDSDGDGVAETRTVFLDGLYSPFGMALVGGNLYIANANAVLRFPYSKDETHIAAPGVKVADLPSGYNHHWTKNLLAAPDGKSLFVSIGSNSNIGDNGMQFEEGRARIDKLDLATGKLEPYATGLRNPNGMAWEPQTRKLWVAVNERDEIGSDLVPDYITSVTEGAFYGWPYSYYAQHVDARVQPQRPDLVANAIAPDYAVGPHTASLGFTFSFDATLLPPEWRSGAFIGQHGSWDRRPKSGYRVIYVPFENGKPSGSPRDVLTGFLSENEDTTHGRPVGVTLNKSGALLVADDVGGIIWRVVGK